MGNLPLIRPSASTIRTACRLDPPLGVRQEKRNSALNDASKSFRGRVRAMLHGIALGDALGAPVEKLSAAESRTRYGRVTSLDARWHKMDLPPEARNHRVRGNGIVTDDTLMTLALMDLYAEADRHLDAWDMADGMVRQIAWIKRWVPELQREAMLIDRLYPRFRMKSPVGQRRRHPVAHRR